MCTTENKKIHTRMAALSAMARSAPTPVTIEMNVNHLPGIENDDDCDEMRSISKDLLHQPHLQQHR